LSEGRRRWTEIALDARCWTKGDLCQRFVSGTQTKFDRMANEKF